MAYETVEDSAGRLPLLAPMSAVAGTMAPVIGSYYLAKCNHGKGMLLGEILGQRYGKVVVIGDGVVGRHAAKAADGMGAHVFIVGRHPERAAQWQRDISVHSSISRHRRRQLAVTSKTPTSELGKQGITSAPCGVPDHPLNPLSMAIGAEATFVARTLDTDTTHLVATLERAAAHKGAAFIV